MLFPNAAAHLQVPEHPLLSKTDILFYTSPVYSAASFSRLHIPVSYRSASGYTENGSSQRSLQAGFSALWLDISENDMPCSSLFLPLCFNIAANNLNRCTARSQQTETLTPECPLPEFFPDLWIFFFQQTAACTFIRIDKFTEF